MANKNMVSMIVLVLILLISGSEARAEIYDPMCPGLGFPGGYCKKGNTCCCKKKKTFGPLHVPASTA
ncbi:hypothetical protein CARUB_v10015714mg [Capsella rubella]|uniref:Uncharacterized protein n=1 Tax=Capsella rubella TaxID=81985 RepID=R0HRN0_9BRAS|nr:hypothetical protein CARUB_v10015714mg [Capsella rubella]